MKDVAESVLSRLLNIAKANSLENNRVRLDCHSKLPQ